MNKLVLTSQLMIVSGFLAGVQAADEGKVNFEKDVYPFIKASCVECHRAPYEKNGRIRKPKSDLRFDAAFGIVKGGDLGVIVVPGKPEESPMLQRTLLDPDHDDFMPSSTLYDPLTKEQQEILKKWIEQGADFGGWKGNEEGKPEGAKDEFEKK